MFSKKFEQSGICKFLWAGAALIGIHLTTPFMSILLEHKVTPLKLLEVLPKLYSELISYEKPLTQFHECGFPSLDDFFLDPFTKETSCFGIGVCNAFKEFVEFSDKALMNLYLKKNCQELREVLKRQRDNQYGFGYVVDSPQDIRKNMSEEMLKDPDANHTKSIDNFFGNLDREVRKAGLQGFDKAASDLVIKYSKDLIATGHVWHKKENRMAAKEISIKQTNFDQQQKDLALKGIDSLDAVNLFTANKVIKCISDCQRSHNGPVMDIDALDLIFANLASDKKQLHKLLNLEIRYRKFNLTEVKSTCPLFRQKGLTITEKTKNLKTLISSQLEFRALADVENLEKSISKADTDSDIDILSELQDEEQATASQPKVTEKKENVNLDISSNKFVIGMFKDGPCPGEIISVTDKDVTINFLEPASINREVSLKFWKWPAMIDLHTFQAIYLANQTFFRHCASIQQ